MTCANYYIIGAINNIIRKKKKKISKFSRIETYILKYITYMEKKKKKIKIINIDFF